MRVPCALTPAIVCVPRSSFFQATVSPSLAAAGTSIFALERIFQRPLHSAERSSHLLGRLGIGVQDEIAPRHGIIDEHKRLRLPRGR